MAKTSRAEWARRVERWQRSGLGAAEFARREGLDARQLSWWKWRLGRSAAEPGSPTLVPVRVVARASLAQEDAVAGGPIEIALPSGARLRVPSGVDEPTLLRVLRALEATCS